MRDDDWIRLRHMIEAAETVGVFVGGRQRSDLDEDRMLLFAVLRAIEVFGEPRGFRIRGSVLRRAVEYPVPRARAARSYRSSHALVGPPGGSVSRGL